MEITQKMNSWQCREMSVRGVMDRYELPTWGLAVVVYGGWLALTLCWHALPWPICLAAGSWLVAWHMSLQHEVLHGHPTRNRVINGALGFLPLSLWLPYLSYRESHLHHHREPFLTNPAEDPESNYISVATWQAMGPLRRALFRANTTLLGRVTIGPAIGIARFLAEEARRVKAGSHLGLWAGHLLAAAAVAVWLTAVCHVSLLSYVLLAVYPGFALALIRSFAEHKVAVNPDHRTAIVEKTQIFGLLFLYNNLHVVHHIEPSLAWYRIPGYFRQHRAALIAHNGGLLYAGYRDIFRRFWRKPQDQMVQPSF